MTLVLCRRLRVALKSLLLVSLSFPGDSFSVGNGPIEKAKNLLSIAAIVILDYVRNSQTSGKQIEPKPGNPISW